MPWERLDHMVKVVDVSSKFARARDRVREVYGDDYSQEIAPWKELILQAAREGAVGLGEALVSLFRSSEDSGDRIMLSAAFMELAEEAHPPTVYS